MVDPATLLDQLAQLATGLDDAAWETLSNRGLLRRARKDYAPEHCALDASGQKELKVKVQEHCVSFTSPDPTKTDCSCGASKMCRHRLMALIFLAEQGSKTPSQNSPAPGQVLLSLSCKDLETWRGVAQWRKAWKLLEQDQASVVHETPGLKVRFEQNRVEVNFLGQNGLDGAMLGTKTKSPEEWVLAAAISYRKAHGMEDIKPAPIQRSKPDINAPRSRGELLTSAQMLMQQILAGGLSRPAPHYAARLSTLSIALQAHRLPRLANELRSISLQLQALTEKKPDSDPATVFSQMSRSYALGTALASEQGDRADLTGASQRYLSTLPLELMGVGAHHWRTASGYRGLTIHFVDPASGAFYAWNDVRVQEHDRGFDPRQRYRQAGPWQGLRSPAQAACSHLRLTEVKRTPQGRLSSGKDGRARVLGATKTALLGASLRRCSDWTQLSAQAKEFLPRGLKIPAQRRDHVLVSVAHWGDAHFDSVSQCFFWEIYDEQDQSVALRLPYTAEQSDAIEFLERLDPSATPIWALFCRIEFQDKALVLKPISILFDREEDAVLSLTLDCKSKSLAKPPPAPPVDVHPPSSQTQSPSLLLEVIRYLERQGEAGQVDRSDPRLKALVTMCHDAGHLTLSKRLGVAWGPEGSPGDLLKARYLCSVYQSLLDDPRARTDSNHG